jgi:tetratricopeptide (TPR) repeat protein
MEAVGHLRQALSLLATLPESGKRHAREIALQVTHADSLMKGRGFAHPDIEPVSERLRVLCEAVGDRVQLGVALIRLANYCRNRGQIDRATSLAEQVLEIAGQADARALAWSAHMQLAMTESSRGNFASALAHHQRAMAIYDPARDGTTGKWGPDNTGLDATSLWYLGYPDRALQCAREAVAGKRRSPDSFGLCEALFIEACLHWLRRDATSLRERAQELTALSEAQGLPFWLAAGKVLHAAALATSGVGETPAAAFDGLERGRTGAGVAPHALGLLADVALGAGQHAEALTILERALALSAQTGQHSFDAELYRLKGEVLLAQQVESPKFKVGSPHPGSDAQECFRQALEIARRQEAKSLELRAATSLARLLRDQGKRAEARDLLAPIYNWFTEGFDTRDLIDAKALLGELS